MIKMLRDAFLISLVIVNAPFTAFADENSKVQVDHKASIDNALDSTKPIKDSLIELTDDIVEQASGRSTKNDFREAQLLMELTFSVINHHSGLMQWAYVYDIKCDSIVHLQATFNMEFHRILISSYKSKLNGILQYYADDIGQAQSDRLNRLVGLLYDNAIIIDAKIRETH
ncbi:MAG: hypothetical protein SGI97_01460 [candidate division Zixibacteria bacterium]|nr:hypothetical protein [candidate division Zixibacteria bacterium]